MSWVTCYSVRDGAGASEGGGAVQTSGAAAATGGRDTEAEAAAAGVGDALADLARPRAGHALAEPRHLEDVHFLGFGQEAAARRRRTRAEHARIVRRADSVTAALTPGDEHVLARRRAHIRARDGASDGRGFHLAR
jgi:hypothetical protein